MYSDALLMKASELYYYSRLSQGEIGRKLGVSSPTVSRMLQEAMDRGIIEVKIRDTLERVKETEEALKSRFGLDEAVVIEVPQGTEQNLRRKLLGRKGSELFQNFCPRGSTVGIGCGVTIYEFVQSLDPSRRFPELRVIPLMGGWGKEETERETNRLASLMARTLGCSFSYLLAPAIVSSRKVRDILLQEPQIRQTISLWSSVDTAFFSIGPELREENFPYIPSDFLSMDEARRAGGAGDVLGRIIDDRGLEAELSYNDQLVSIPLDILKKIPRRIALGCGPQKYRGIKGALEARLATVLITDFETATYLLHLEAMKDDSIR